jgi:hypothetical protein
MLLADDTTLLEFQQLHDGARKFRVALIVIWRGMSVMVPSYFVKKMIQARSHMQ